MGYGFFTGSLQDAGEPLAVLAGPVLPVRILNTAGEVGNPEVEAAAANRIEQFVGAGGEEKQGRVSGRFLEGLQESVGGLPVHAVGLKNNPDFATALVGGFLDIDDEAAHGILRPFALATLALGADFNHTGFATWAQGKAIGVKEGVFVSIEEFGGDGLGDGFNRREVTAVQQDAVAKAFLLNGTFEHLNGAAFAD